MNVSLCRARSDDGIRRRCFSVFAGMVQAACVIVGLAGCAAITDTQPPAAKSCAFDNECIGGSCEFGRCSPFPKSPSETTCAFDSQCPGGSCQFGKCSPFPKSNSATTPGGLCMLDMDCSAGSHCRAGRCSP